MLEIGSLVDGKYKILRVVGKGGMSVVYQAVNEKANKIWAIKEVRKDGVQNFEVVKQNLIVETELLKRFSHPNLPSIIDVIDTDDSFLIVMDYIEGNSLSKAIETSGAQSQDDVIEWSKQLCDVLGYLHSRKPPIIYRDMKPANVMLKPDGNISLIDFGTAREFKSSSVEDTTCLGTQGYAAPEQYGGHGQTDARTDIYCLGATMYHLITGHNPSMPPYEMYPIRQWNPMLSSGLEEIIIKCTQRNPNDRYQSCAELLYALEHFQDLDIENKKVQSLKWKVFLSTLIATLITAVGAIAFLIAGNAVVAQTYDSYIRAADEARMSGEDKNSVVEKYKEAIYVEPGRTDAYYGILQCYMQDDRLSTTEKDNITLMLRFVDAPDQRIIDTEPALISYDKEAYARLMKELADDVFFCLGDNDISDNNIATGVSFSIPLYNKALNNTDDESLREDINRYLSIANCYTNASGISATGKVTVDVRQVYSDMTGVVNQMIPTDNIVKSLRVYTLFADLMRIKVDLFRAPNSGVPIGDYNSLLNLMNSKLFEIEQSEIFQSNKTNNDNRLGKMFESARKLINEDLTVGYGKSAARNGG